LPNLTINRMLAVVTIFLVIGAIVGYGASFQVKRAVVTSVSTTIVTNRIVTTSTQSVINYVYTATTTNTTVTTTNTTIIAAQYLNITQGMKDGGQIAGIGCGNPCGSSEVNTTFGFPVSNNTFFYSQVNVNAPGVSVAIFPSTPTPPLSPLISVTLEITNTTITTSAYFVILVSDSKLPLTVYVWYYGESS
jgi:hypothetical protein